MASGQRNVVGVNANRAAKSSPQTPRRSNLPATTIASPSPVTFILSDGPISPPVPGRKRRRYDEYERLRVAETRRIGACEKHRASKTTCTHDHECSNDPIATAKVVQRYLDDNERHEKIALGYPSSREHIKDLKLEVARNIAAVDSPSPTSETQNSPPKTRTSTPKSKSRIKTEPSTNLGSRAGYYGAFKVAPSAGRLSKTRLNPQLAPKNPMSPPTMRLQKTLYSPIANQMGGVAMTRGDSGVSGHSYYSNDTGMPSLAYSAGPPSTQFSPPLHTIPYMPTRLPTLAQPKGIFPTTISHIPPPTSIVQGNRSIVGSEVPDPAIFPEEDDNQENFEYTEFLNDYDSYFVSEAFPELPNSRSK